MGRIKSWNESVVFVVYNCGENWTTFDHYTAEATDPQALDFIVSRGPIFADTL